MSGWGKTSSAGRFLKYLLMKTRHFITQTILGFCIGASLCGAPDPNNALFERENLFEIAPASEYKSIRIPCIQALSDNTVLAIAAARSAVSDWAVIRLVMRRSTDGGKTWGPVTVLAEDGKNVVDNPVTIWDESAKTLHFLYQTNYERVWYKRSTDGGVTFTEAVDITGQLSRFQELYKWNVIAPGPGHGIQMKSGRLVVPVWLCPGEPNPSGVGRSHRPSITSVIYSDDHGKTWHCGDLVPETLRHMNETVAVPADDGGVWLYIRNEELPAYQVAISYSNDGATNWSKSALHKDLYSPICFSSVLRVSGAPDKSRIIFCNPDSRSKNLTFGKWRNRLRENLTLRLSYDEGKTWPVVKVIEPGRSSYSDMTMLKDGTILCLYEQGYVEDNRMNNRYVTLARFNIEWLTDSQDSLKSAK